MSGARKKLAEAAATRRKSIAKSAVILGLGVAVGFWAFDGNGTRRTTPAPDTPPGEYVYLDSARVLAYLGQIAGGLSPSEKRTLATQEEAKGSAKVGPVEVGGTQSSEQSVEQTVTPTATDRFYTLLQQLRGGRSRTAFGATRVWLHELDATLDATNTFDELMGELCRTREGDFVRIADAHLFLAPYASVFPRVSYASSYLGGEISRPRRPLYAPVSDKESHDVAAYLAAVGNDPRLPFVLPSLRATGGSNDEVVTFLVPARYSGIVDEPSLLSGNLTVVGKVVYRDLTRRNGKSCGVPVPGSGPREYLDRQTVSLFAPALAKASPSILANLQLDPATILERVTLSATFASPVVVVVPVAIYQ